MLRQPHEDQGEEQTLIRPSGKESCLALLDEVDAEGIVITKHGRPVAKLIPHDADSSSLIGALAGDVRITGNVLSTGAWMSGAIPPSN